MDQEFATTAVPEPSAELAPLPDTTAAPVSSPIKIMPTFIDEILKTNANLGQMRTQLADLTLGRHRLIRQHQLVFCYGQVDQKEAELTKQIDDTAAAMTGRLNEIAQVHGVPMSENWVVDLQHMTFVRQTN